MAKNRPRSRGNTARTLRHVNEATQLRNRAEFAIKKAGYRKQEAMEAKSALQIQNRMIQFETYVRQLHRWGSASNVLGPATDVQAAIVGLAGLTKDAVDKLNKMDQLMRASESLGLVHMILREAAIKLPLQIEYQFWVLQDRYEDRFSCHAVVAVPLGGTESQERSVLSLLDEELRSGPFDLRLLKEEARDFQMYRTLQQRTLQQPTLIRGKWQP